MPSANSVEIVKLTAAAPTPSIIGPAMLRDMGWVSAPIIDVECYGVATPLARLTNTFSPWRKSAWKQPKGAAGARLSGEDEKDCRDDRQA